MTIDEAVDDLAEERDFEKGQGNEEMVSAIKLGIEALKRELLNRKGGRGYPCNRLPGETEE